MRQWGGCCCSQTGRMPRPTVSPSQPIDTCKVYSFNSCTYIYLFMQMPSGICKMSTITIQTMTMYSANMLSKDVCPDKSKEYKCRLIRIDIILLNTTLFWLCCVTKAAVFTAEQYFCTKTHKHTHTHLKSRACLYLIKVNERLLCSACRPAVIWSRGLRCGHQASEPSLRAPRRSEHSSPEWRLLLLPAPKHSSQP